MSEKVKFSHSFWNLHDTKADVFSQGGKMEAICDQRLQCVILVILQSITMIIHKTVLKKYRHVTMGQNRKKPQDKYERGSERSE